ncbi:MAG: nucleotide exchange factor GrpE [Epulopiscium sp.]|nr:nucleotide exchange factor GrpE [Candidatus Epulonipiscium sp.]
MRKRVYKVDKDQILENENTAETIGEEEIEVIDTKDSSDNSEGIEDILGEKDKLLDELKDRLQRTMAEFDNFRKRTIKEKAVLYEDGVRSTIEQILPVIDNFERALNTSKEENEKNPFFEGMTMIYRQFKDILSSMGVEDIQAVGEQFNPNLHNAVTHVEDENFGESEIIEEFQKGYIYKDKVIRYSMVKVAN